MIDVPLAINSPVLRDSKTLILYPAEVVLKRTWVLMYLHCPECKVLRKYRILATILTGTTWHYTVFTQTWICSGVWYFLALNCWFLSLVCCLLSCICDPTQANEALWGRYQNWHFEFNIFFNIQGTFWHQNGFHIILLSKVTDILISNCLITLKINYQDTGRQIYWFVHKPIEDIKNNWIKNIISCHLFTNLSLWTHRIDVKPYF